MNFPLPVQTTLHPDSHRDRELQKISGDVEIQGAQEGFGSDWDAGQLPSPSVTKEMYSESDMVAIFAPLLEILGVEEEVRPGERGPDVYSRSDIVAMLGLLEEMVEGILQRVGDSDIGQ
jgi:hypothetical protein